MRRSGGGASSPAAAPPRKRIRFPAEILLIGNSKGLRPSRALRGLIWRELRFPVIQGGYSFEGFRFRRRGRGALRSPTSPRATGCERVHTLSHSPGAGLPEILVPDEGRGYSFESFRFRRRECGALCSPTPPRATGCERVLTLSRSPGAGLAEIWVSDGAGSYSLEGFCSRRRGRGALRSPTSPRVTGCERVLTLSRSPERGVGTGAVVTGEA